MNRSFQGQQRLHKVINPPHASYSMLVINMSTTIIASMNHNHIDGKYLFERIFNYMRHYKNFFTSSYRTPDVTLFFKSILFLHQYMCVFEKTSH